MTTDDNITLAEAAKAVGVHFNTIRNWRKQGRLVSAQKVIERGVEIWVVSLSEVQKIAEETHNLRPPTPYNIPSQNPITDGPTIDQQPMTTSLQNAQFQNMTKAISEAVNQSVKPLADLLAQRNALVDKQSEDLQKLNRENGEISTELRLLKERLEALEAVQAARVVSQQAITTPPADITPVAEIAPQPVKKGFWQKLFGL